MFVDPATPQSSQCHNVPDETLPVLAFTTSQFWTSQENQQRNDCKFIFIFYFILFLI